MFESLLCVLQIKRELMNENEKDSTSFSLSKNYFKMVEQGQLHIKLLAVGSQ